MKFIFEIIIKKYSHTARLTGKAAKEAFETPLASNIILFFFSKMGILQKVYRIFFLF